MQNVKNNMFICILNELKNKNFRICKSTDSMTVFRQSLLKKLLEHSSEFSSHDLVARVEYFRACWWCSDSGFTIF